MSIESCAVDEEPSVEILFVADNDESSEEPPMEEWSSLILAKPAVKEKVLLYEQGLYHPGSGNVCAKYIPMSFSGIATHPYFKYPSVKDPGIAAALLQPEMPKIYADDGQELYINLCNEMDQCPVKLFHKGLVEDKIDLKYYLVNPKGVRCMAMALRFNIIVKVLNLSDSFLSEDACYHLGEMLVTNTALQELNLSGCRIGPAGAKRIFFFLPSNRGLRELNLNRNQLGDAGMVFVSKAIFQGIDIQKLHLSYNNIGQKGAGMLAEALETHNKFVFLDISWNNLISGTGTFDFLTNLGDNKLLQHLNLAWNGLSGLKAGMAIGRTMKAPNLRYLDLGYNRLNGEAIEYIAANIMKPKKLVTLDLSYNPMTPEDAMEILSKFTSPAVKVQKLIMENVFVKPKFLALLTVVKAMKNRKKFETTYGGLVGGFKPDGPNMKDLLLRRADFLCQKQKRNKVDIALLILQLAEQQSLMTVKVFLNVVKDAGAPLDDDLLNEMANVFAGPATKIKTVNLTLLADFVKRKWPEKKLKTKPALLA